MDPQRPARPTELNVLGQRLEPCCFAPQTGFYRDGYCRTGPQDLGRHIVCAEVTAEFLALGLDPYPRKPEADFAYTEDAGKENPFAALAGLKAGGKPKTGD